MCRNSEQFFKGRLSNLLQHRLLTVLHTCASIYLFWGFAGISTKSGAEKRQVALMRLLNVWLHNTRVRLQTDKTLIC